MYYVLEIYRKMNELSSDDEAERRRRVADEKMWGAIIETLERSRKSPVARSIMFRAFNLHQLISEFQKTVKTMGIDVGHRTVAPEFTRDETNFLIRTYNTIIKDLHSNFGKKDSYIRTFTVATQLDVPTINGVAKSLFKMATTLSQIIWYLTRWT